MTVLALKLSRRANAVSSLHGQVSRAMWSGLCPGRDRGPRADRPHHQRRARRSTWLAPQMRQVYDRHLGPDWPRASGASRASGKRSTRSTTASCGKRTRRLKCSSSRRPCVGAPRGRPSAGANRSEVVATMPTGAQPRRADDRLRAALRHLQARDPDAPGHRRVGRARQRPANARPVRLRRQVAPARRAGQGSSCSRSRS